MNLFRNYVFVIIRRVLNLCPASFFVAAVIVGGSSRSWKQRFQNTANLVLLLSKFEFIWEQLLAFSLVLVSRPRQLYCDKFRTISNTTWYYIRTTSNTIWYYILLRPAKTILSTPFMWYSFYTIETQTSGPTACDCMTRLLINTSDCSKFCYW